MGMYSKVKTICNIGLEGYLIEVETYITPGLPSFKIVGLPDKAIVEAKQRVIAAIKSSGYTFPLRKITINLSPSNIPKFGSGFDLPIAMGIIACILKVESHSNKYLNNSVFYGELGLDASIKETLSIPIIMETCSKLKFDCIIPITDIARIPLDISIFKARNVKSCFDYILGKTILERYKNNSIPFTPIFPKQESLYMLSGLENELRTIEVASAGRHHISLQGPPGCGKTLLAQALYELSPLCSIRDKCDIERIYSVSKHKMPNTIPLRNPYHNSPLTTILGGGSRLLPGEVSLAHKGILFLDELPNYSKRIIESLKQPLDSKKVTLSFKDHKITLPSDFQLVATLNKCPCGILGHPDKQCTCTPTQLKNFQDKISSAIWDRIDINLDLLPIKYEQLTKVSTNERFAFIKSVKEKILTVREIMSQNKAIDCTQSLQRLLKKDATKMLKQYYKKNIISNRHIFKTLSIARTIAYLDDKDLVDETHIAEALSYRWNKRY